MFDWITAMIESGGHAAVVLLMVLENLFPPLPSELIMPLAGYAAARGDTSLSATILAGTVGSTIGALPWYWVARRMGAARLKRWASRHGRWLTLEPADVDRADAWFDRHCAKTVFFGRLIPTVRTLVSVPAGIFEMGFARFLAFTAAGSALWVAALAIAGHELGERHGDVTRVLEPLTNAVLALLVALYLYRLLRWKRRAA